MRSGLISLVVLSSISAALGSWVPYSQVKYRRQSAFLDCLEGAGLDPVVKSNSSDYSTDILAFNRRFHWQPVAIVYPEDANGVSAAIKCGASHDIKVNARSGGHSYAAFALGGEDGHLTVSLDKFRHLSLSGDIATIGAGNHLGDVALYLWENGKRALAHGTCAYVGIGGHAGQGGWGFPSRLWGLLSDQVQSLEIVTADGQIRTASQTENADLFWAATGAGASFGIITSFAAVTHAALDAIKFTFTFPQYGAQEASNALQAWQEFTNDPVNKLDPAVGLRLQVNPGESPTGVYFLITGLYYGVDEAQVNATFAPLLEKLGQPSGYYLTPQDWITAVVSLAEVDTPAQLNTTLAPDTPDYFYATSSLVSSQEPMTQTASDALFAYFYGPGASTAVKWFVIFSLDGGGDSAITRVGPDHNAFNGRDTLYSILYYGTIPTESVSDADGIAFIQGMKQALESNMPDTHFKGYVNYLDSTYSAEEAHQRYYPTHTANLTSLKNKYDPSRVFYFPQDF